VPRRALLLILPAVLAACAPTGENAGPGASPPAPAASGQAPAAACPVTLAFVKERLVTPYPKLEEFIGKDALDETFNKPIDQMIAEGGGIEASIEGGERHVKEDQVILQGQDQVRADYRKAGMTDEWIDTYLTSVQDGVTINQAFVDSVKCRQARQKEQTQASPAQ